MSNIIEIKVDDNVVAISRLIHTDETTGRTAWELRADDIKLTGVPEVARFALASIAWHVAMHATSLAEADPAQRAAIEAYWKASTPAGDRGAMRSSLAGDTVLDLKPASSAS